jgi:hypothetical protein
MNTKRRPQRQKPSKVRQVQELRRSNAASPVPSGTEYRRKEKYDLAIADLEEDTDYSEYDWG